MAWCRTGDKPLAEPMMALFTGAYIYIYIYIYVCVCVCVCVCVTPPLCIKTVLVFASAFEVHNSVQSQDIDGCL